MNDAANQLLSVHENEDVALREEAAARSKALDGIKDYNKGILKLLGDLSHMGTTAVPKLSNALGQVFNVQNSTALLSYLNDFEAFSEGVKDVAGEISSSFKDMATSINTELSNGVSAMISGLALMVGAAAGSQKPIENIGAFLGRTLADMAINIGQYAITHGVAIEAIKESLKSMNGVLAIAAGVALIALGAGMKSTIQRKAEESGVPALAQGGLAYGPTLAMVGDNRGASADPEVIAPLSKLKDMLGGSAFQVYGRISGNDIAISNTRGSRDRNRY